MTIWKIVKRRSRLRSLTVSVVIILYHIRYLISDVNIEKNKRHLSDSQESEQEKPAKKPKSKSLSSIISLQYYMIY
jgi:hypothetical protein